MNSLIKIRNATEEDRMNARNLLNFLFLQGAGRCFSKILSDDLREEYFDEFHRKQNTHIVIAQEEAERNFGGVIGVALYSTQEDYFRFDAVYIKEQVRKTGVFLGLIKKLLENEANNPKEKVRFLTSKGNNTVKRMAKKMQCRKVYDFPYRTYSCDDGLELYEADLKTVRSYLSRFVR